jgi:hypothetical protein
LDNGLRKRKELGSNADSLLTVIDDETAPPDPTRSILTFGDIRKPLASIHDTTVPACDELDKQVDIGGCGCGDNSDPLCCLVPFTLGLVRFDFGSVKSVSLLPRVVVLLFFNNVTLGV